MARLPRLHAPGVPHYVAQRAAAERALFADDEAYRTFVALLADAVRAHGVALHAYVLLPDEIRFVATPKDATSLPRLMQTLGRRYAPIVHRGTGRSGPLWTGRYRSTLVDPDAYLLAAMLHVEQRPRMRAIVVDAAAWPWSSERHHAGLEQLAFVADHAAYWALSNTPFERQALYRNQIEALQAPSLAERIERAVDRGWALGDETFVEATKSAASRRMAPRKAGRPRSPCP